MITPQEIKHQARCLWNSGRVLRAWLGCEQLFPLVFPAGAPTLSQLGHDPDPVLDWKRSVEEYCQCHSGHGYRIEYAEIEHAKQGRYRLPAKLVFDQVSDLIAFIDMGREVKRFALLLGQIRKSDPRLMPWCEQHPMKVLEYENDWEQLLLVLNYFQKHPAKGHVSNEIDISGVEHEFVGQHQPVINQLLDYVAV